MKPNGSGPALGLVLLCLLGRPGTLRADAHQDFLDGMAAEHAKTWSEAAQDFLRVTAKLPNYAPAWKQLASCRFFMDDFEGAAATADRYLRLAPSDTAFAQWDDAMRARNHLPPRVLPTPTPAPLVPTPVPSILQAAPPPDLDAEPAPLEPGTSPSADTETNPTPQPTPAAAQSPAATPAPAVPPYGNPPPAPMAPTFGNANPMPEPGFTTTPAIPSPPPPSAPMPPPPPLP
jgi:hypothetical protein